MGSRERVRAEYRVEQSDRDRVAPESYIETATEIEVPKGFDRNVVVSALRFFYGTTLGRPDAVPLIAYGKRQRSIPSVLSVGSPWEGPVAERLPATGPPDERVLLPGYCTACRPIL